VLSAFCAEAPEVESFAAAGRRARLAQGIAAARDGRSLLIAAALTAGWLGVGVVAAPQAAYWLCLPVMLIAARFGWRGAAAAGAVAAGAAMTSSPPGIDGAGGLVAAGFPLVAGIVVVLLMRDVRAADRAVVAALNSERDVALRAVAERDALSTRLSFEASHDTLTGLPNRSLFLERLEQALRGRQPGQSVGVLFVDLDDFKTVNDSLGHAAGDELLVGVAGRLKNALRSDDLVARFGGDEFAVLLHDGGGERALGLVNRLLGVLRAPFALSAGMASGRASGGLVTTALGGTDDVAEQAADLLRRADLAMYAAKAAGGSGCVEFRDELQHAMLERLALQDDITEAMIREDFSLQYQPVMDLATSRLVAVEALLRWHHPARGDVPPDVFIPIAEKSGAIVQMGLWVLQQACLDLKRWDELHPGNSLHVAINVSARQLRDSSVGPQVARVLHRMDVDPSRLILEVTESLVMDDGEAAAATLWQLRALGIRIAVDDFGTGYSSLSRLVDLPLDDIKIDRSFIRELDISDAGATIVSAAIAMAHGLGLNVVAEGVETQEQLAFLLKSGCDQGQGYLFSRPLVAERISELLVDGPYLRYGASTDELDQPQGLRPTRPSPTIIPVMPRHR
jgi:diguanylate cyclase (GGDEF)-like protein